MQNSSSVSDSTKLGAMIHLLEIAMKFGKYLPVIVVSFAGLNLVMAVNDFLVNNTGFGILNSIFALGGFIFLAQLHQRRKIHSYDYYYNYKKGSSKRIVVGARKERELEGSDKKILVGTGQESENIW
jgi:hypothetical protein